MKKFLVFMTLLVSMFAGAQEFAPVPKEMNQAKFMVGTWKGQLTMYWMGKESKGPGTVVSKMSLGGRYLESDHTYVVDKMTMSGKQMLTYDANKKTWVSYWFDSAEAGAMEMKGQFKNGVLVGESGEMEMAGMPGKFRMRATYKRIDDKHVDFLLEMNQGDKWSPMMKGRYTKVK